MQTQLRMMSVTAAALICAFLVTICALFVDRPVESYIVVHQHYRLFYQALASPSLLSLPLAVAYLTFHALRKISGRSALRHADLLLSLAVAVAVSTVAKDELKWIIGRPWPGTWVQYGAYVIRPFSDDALFGSFPSGHTTYIAAPLFVLWWRLPQFRPLWLGIILAVMIGLVGAGYHFVGDVIAGFFLGLAAAAGTVAVWPRSVVSQHAPALQQQGALQPSLRTQRPL